LEMAYRSNPDSIAETLDRVTKTMLGQIDNLTQIANEFSNFAKMPRAKNSAFIINDLISEVFNLFLLGDGKDVDMHIEMPREKYTVFADRNQLVSVFNNLLKNATEAIPSDRQGKIMVSLYQDANMVGVRVSDNGVGIPKDKREKVFVPNFTTKSSGTGLGLAISKNIVESVKGEIYFRTIVGEGTDFHVRLPIVPVETFEEVS
ncbi:MAG: GHKL domain-containing protein, partial [Saprospiraceae bacterium]|nr:GHKL domain-containing protein [Saprospiraceae bacterium]